MHSTKVIIIADQEICWSGQTYNIHEISSITLDETGTVTHIHMKSAYQIEKDNDQLSFDVKRSEVNEKIRSLILSVENLIHEHVTHSIKGNHETE